MSWAIYSLLCHQCSERWDVDCGSDDEAEREACPTCGLEDVEIESRTHLPPRAGKEP